MRQSTKFTITVIWILFSRSYDAFCTYRLTPDLSKEANPLASVLRLGWTPILLIIGLLICYAIYAYYKATFQPKKLMPPEKGYTFSQFTAYLYLGKKDSWTAMFYKLPKEISRFNQYMGVVLTKCLVFVGFVSTIMWLLINYTEYYARYHSATMIYTIIIIGGTYIIYKWNREMYKGYLAK